MEDLLDYLIMKYLTLLVSVLFWQPNPYFLFNFFNSCTTYESVTCI